MAQGKESALLSSTQRVVSLSSVCSCFSPCQGMFHGCWDSVMWRSVLLCVDLWLVLWTRISRILAHGTEHISGPIRMTWTGDMMNPQDEWSNMMSLITRKLAKIFIKD